MSEHRCNEVVELDLGDICKEFCRFLINKDSEKAGEQLSILINVILDKDSLQSQHYAIVEHKTLEGGKIDVEKLRIKVAAETIEEAQKEIDKKFSSSMASLYTVLDVVAEYE